MIHLLKKIYLWGLLLLFFAEPAKLFAQNDISDTIVRERIQCIQNILEKGKKNANTWWYGWFVGYSAATVGQGVVYFKSKVLNTQQDMALGAANSLLGAAGQLIAPLNPGKQAKSLANIPESTPEERIQKLSYAEDLLKETAKTEKRGKSWQTHALYCSVNLSCGLITWLGFDRSVWEGVGNFALNTAITEIQIWTQPTQTLKDYQWYCSKYISEIPPLAYKPKPVLYVSAYPGGIALKLLF
jgi:hypothetical protein